ncbi:MAG: hypothetical protein OWT27_01180, partial [Firmicutes bacterium]|nr:hypothetical protein [Bacillota bacterium]
MQMSSRQRRRRRVARWIFGAITVGLAVAFARLESMWQLQWQTDRVAASDIIEAIMQTERHHPALASHLTGAALSALGLHTNV